MSQLAIEIHKLSKKYNIAALKQQNTTFAQAFVEGIRQPVRRVRSLLSGNATGAADLNQEFWALRGVSFTVEHGETLGVIGHNGAGKSTLLKLLSRITHPSEGWANINGRVASLLEVGTGFNVELTGRENIYLNGSILGMSTAEINAKFDEIVAFAGVENFIDTPVKHYSSGMKVRLAFAVAAHLEPEILLIDEVLSVGDAEFQKKSIGRMSEVTKSGRTILFVSHNMGAVVELCQRVIWLDKGQVRMDGKPDEVVSAYLKSNIGFSNSGSAEWTEGIANEGETDFLMHRVSIVNHEGERTDVINPTEPFYVELEFELFDSLPYMRAGFHIKNELGLVLFESYDMDNPEYRSERYPGRYVMRCKVPANWFKTGSYYLSVNVGIPNVRNMYTQDEVTNLEISDITFNKSSLVNIRRLGVLLPYLEWEQEEISPAPSEQRP